MAFMNEVEEDVMWWPGGACWYTGPSFVESYDL
jgi:hypothetical protein